MQGQQRRAAAIAISLNVGLLKPLFFKYPTSNIFHCRAALQWNGKMLRKYFFPQHVLHSLNACIFIAQEFPAQVNKELNKEHHPAWPTAQSCQPARGRGAVQSQMKPCFGSFTLQEAAFKTKPICTCPRKGFSIFMNTDVSHSSEQWPLAPVLSRFARHLLTKHLQNTKVPDRACRSAFSAPS